MGVALPHRHLGAERGPLGFPRALPCRLRCRRLHRGRLCSAGVSRWGGWRSSPRHRPREPEERRAAPRARGPPPRLAGGGPRRAARHAGLALRSLEGPARRRRGLPMSRRRCRPEARARRVHGARRPGRVGSVQADQGGGQKDPDVDTFTNLTGVGNVEVNAFQRLSEVCIQKSIREGFGLVVSETFWKGHPHGRRRGRGHPHADARRSRRIPGRLGRGVRREATLLAPQPRGRRGLARRGRRPPGSTSSFRA